MGTFRAVAAVLSLTVGTVVIAAVPAQAATALTVKGTQSTHPAPYPEQLVPGLFASDTVTRIDYPARVLGMDSSIAVAVAGIANAIAATTGPIVVAGFSQGAVAVARVQQELMSLPATQRPTAGELSFITIGDPSGPGGILGTIRNRIPVIGLTPITAPDTPYDTVVVDGEYDGWADFPDRKGNLISVANAMMGVVYVHGGYETVPGGLDLSAVPAANITTTTNGLGGRTTRYLIPTPQLPLVAPLRQIGVPEPIVAALEKPLKAKVDAGYTRHDAAPVAAATTQRQATPAPRASTGVALGAPRRPAAAAAGHDDGTAGNATSRPAAKSGTGRNHLRSAA